MNTPNYMIYLESGCNPLFFILYKNAFQLHPKNSTTSSKKLTQNLSHISSDCKNLSGTINPYSNEEEAK